jgi:hypothetical protein
MRARFQTHLVPADAAPDWHSKIRTSLIDGESAFANGDDMAVVVKDVEDVHFGGESRLNGSSANRSRVNTY